jgi:ribonucleoside-diphosphate reductase alpha chain
MVAGANMDKLTNSTTDAEAITISDPQLLEITQPGQLRVIRRNGGLARFDSDRIAVAMKKAFIAAEGDAASQSERVQSAVTNLTEIITQRLQRRWPSGGTVHIEAIQDLAELALMRAGEHAVARSYVIYREARRQERLKKTEPSAEVATINVTLDNGKKRPLDRQWLSQLIMEACHDLKDVEPTQIIRETLDNLFDGVAMKDVYKAMVMSARTRVETDPNYSFVTSRLLLNDLYNEALSALNIEHDLSEQTITKLYPICFTAFIKQGIELELLDSSLKDFDLERLSHALKAERDLQFTYLSLQTLHDRYFIHHEGNRIELPQIFYMRVAMGLAHCEGQHRNERAIEFYNLLSSFDYMSSTPTLFNAGTCRPQLSSCYLTTVPDDLNGIYSAIRDNAMLSKFAGGLGNDWTPVRAMGAHIKGTNGKSLGIVPFLNVVDATAVAVNQGGKRKGAVCAYLESWHMDIEEFLELRKNTGDERRRTHDMNTANWVPDLLMKRVFEDKEWSLFSPNEVPDLHDLYGEAFEAAYVAYEEKAQRGEIRRRVMPAKTLWRKMLTMLFETGHPWVTFKDVCNLRSPQQHVGVVHSSNLCTEITLNTSKDEIAVCNLGSINLAQHMKAGQLDTDKLQKTIKTAIRMLDNVIDINYYSVPQARNSNLRHRPIGMGLMGFQDALYQQKIPYASQEAVEFADYCMEHISYHAILASADLAEERGAYESYPGSLWSKGILPIDSIKFVKAVRGKYLDQNTHQTLDWDSVRRRIKAVGMRNSNVMAIAPTATISNICGVTQSTEPTYQNLFVKSNLSGEFTVVNPYMVRDLKDRGLWDEVMIHDLKYHNGSLEKIERVPQDIKQLYATAFEIEPQWLVEAASRRQKWLDQAHSLNLYMAQPSGKKLNSLYRMAWIRGLKTTYYLRTLGATSTEKSTIADSKLNAVSVTMNPMDEPECEACQ